jgi:Coenzyme PQQ synthesis protein D (PqqD)
MFSSGLAPGNNSKKDFVFGCDLCLMLCEVQKDMATQVSFQVNRPQVISQTIEGEVVVINLQTGSYYSLTGAAASIWSAIEHGAAAAQIMDTLAAHFTDCESGLKGVVDSFLNELNGESLIVPVENGRQTANGVLNGAQIKREKFVRPALKKFTDMQELLLLDPIHEVDAAGWPLARPDPNNHADK